MHAIWEVNPAQSIWGAAPLESLLSEWLKERRFNLTLLAGLAAIALTLAMVGIYALISYSVEQRMDELGIRRALGARSRHLLTMVLRHASMLAATGIVVGLLVAAALTRFISSMLFGIEAIDPATFLLLPAAVFVVAAFAASVPALRAVRADPMVSLREQ
jgi:ABC-type antimicrobial peptide transport system permease subunit